MELVELEIETRAGRLDVAAEVDILADGTLVAENNFGLPERGAVSAGPDDPVEPSIDALEYFLARTDIGVQIFSG